MTIAEIVSITQSLIICGNQNIDKEIDMAFSSDLMSDVLTQNEENLLLITGLANIQTIRTAEMADIVCILFVRNKQVNTEMKALAEELNLVLLQCRYSMYHTSGLLFQNGLKPIF